MMKPSFKIVLVSIIAAISFFLFRNGLDKTDYAAETSRLNGTIVSFLKEEGISPEFMVEESYICKIADREKTKSIQKKYRLPDEKVDSLDIIERLKNKVVEEGFSVFESRISYVEDEVKTSLLIGKKKKALFYLEISTPGKKEAFDVSKGKIALVLDDWGYSLGNLKILKKIEQPLTISVLPNLPYSRKIATFSHKRGYDVILHLPLESYKHKNMEEGTIYCDMQDDEIAGIFKSALSDVPVAKGVSNHMGSKATEHRQVMAVIFKEMKKKNLFFLDSLVTKKSVCDELAGEMGVSLLKRDIFLDNVADESYIITQLNKLVSLAKTNGRAVGIGHDRQLTLKVLEKEMENLEKEGIEFVHLSQMVK